MTWTALTFSYGSALTSSKMTQLFDNFAAMAAGDASAPVLSAANASFADGAAAVTKAVGTNSTAIATTAFCEAGFVNNDVGVAGVGAFVMMKVNPSYSFSLASGATSTCSATGLYTYSNATVLAGTWRNICGATIDYTGHFGMCQRIA